MSNAVGESLPSEPDPEPSPFKNVAAAASEFYIEKTFYGKVVENYLALDPDGQFELADKIKTAIGETATEIALADPQFMTERWTEALVNNVPVIFEPQNHAMIVGHWEDDDEKSKLKLSSQYVETPEQKRLLEVGVDAFEAWLEKQ